MKKRSCAAVIAASVMCWLSGYASGTMTSPPRVPVATAYATGPDKYCPSNDALLDVMKRQLNDGVTAVDASYGLRMCQPGNAALQISAAFGEARSVSYLIVLHYWDEKDRWIVDSMKWEASSWRSPQTMSV